MMSTQPTDFSNVHLEGLTDEQVAESRRQHGENTLSPPPATSLCKLYLDKYRDPIIQILLAAAAISLVLSVIEQDFIETIGIFIAIFFATTVGFYFEHDATKKFNILNALNEEQLVKVYRNGRLIEIPRKDVVVGDVMSIEVGDEVPADGQLLQATDLQIDESSLTGEPISSKGVRTEEFDDNDERTYPCNMVLRSTMVMNGHAAAVVTAVGDATEIGKVARTSTEKIETKTPLNLQLDKLATLISKIGSAIAVTTFVVFIAHDILANDLVWQSGDYLKMSEVVLKYFMMSVTLIVMAVPEGLPMAVTLSLALNMRRMLKSNNLVRKLHVCETIGAVTVICTDKTGTLTQNKMQVMDICNAQGNALSTAEERWAQAIALNTTAELSNDGGIGNPTEIALLQWLRQKGVDYRTVRNETAVVMQQPFSTENKYMATVADIRGERYLFVKGAPEIVFGFCSANESEKQLLQQILLTYQ